MTDFVTWNKIPRFNKEWEITEKIDGTNGVLHWGEHDGRFDDTAWLARVDGLWLRAGSRNRWLSPESDNFGFAKWAKENADDLWGLGKGWHFGEWYGQGIQRAYGLTEKRFALFKTGWSDEDLPKRVEQVSTLIVADGSELNATIKGCLEDLRVCGSAHVPGFMKPEGLVVRHIQHGDRFKVLLDNDNIRKGELR